jgi:hypothetical protein
MPTQTAAFNAAELRCTLVKSAIAGRPVKMKDTG